MVKEYNLARTVTWATDPGKIEFGVQLTPPRAQPDHRWMKQVIHLAKMVRKEYLIVTEIGVMGTVGGTLGLFIGLSFWDISSCVVSGIVKAKSWIRKA